MTLRGVTFPIYAAEDQPATISGSGSSGDDLTELTIGHYAPESDDPFAVTDLRVTTAAPEHQWPELRLARRALEMWVHDDHNGPDPDGLSDAATKLWFAARRRARRAAALGATPREQLITIDGCPQPFSHSAPRPAVGSPSADTTTSITIAAHNLDPATLTLEPILDPAARLLGPEPQDPPAEPA